jgi:general secretion pathway protein J
MNTRSLKTTSAKRDYVFRGRPLRSQTGQKGFTLIELLVSIVILALLSVAGYRGLDAVLQARERVAAETKKWQHLSFFFSRLDQDISQAERRRVRDTGGQSLPEWIGHDVVVGDDDAELSFTRAGSSDQGLSHLGPQRIGYRLEQNNIVLLSWPVLDLAQRTRPVRYPLLEGVREFSLNYMGISGDWQTQWPPAGATGGLPQATEVTLTLQSGEKISRVFALQ